MTSRIRQTFRHTIKTSTWLDNSTKRTAEEKMTAMNNIIIYMDDMVKSLNVTNHTADRVIYLLRIYYVQDVDTDVK